MRRTAAILALALAALFITAPAALAHAELESTQPAADSAATTPPSQVVLKFSESVDFAEGAIKVFNSSGARADDGRPATHPDGDHSSVAMSLPSLPDGTYVVTWRVVSDDSHPVHGAFTFAVGQGQVPAGSSNAAQADLARSHGSRTVGGLYALVRTVVFLSLLVLVGGTAFLLTVWPGGWQQPRARRVLYAALIAAFVGTALGIGLQAVYGPGLPLLDAFKPTVLRPVMRTRFGRVWLARMVLLVAFDVALNWFERHRPRPVAVGLATALGLAILGTPGLSAHAATGDLVPLALPVDAVHLAAAALWLGGLAMLLVCVLRADPQEAGWVVPRFSRVALGCVIVLIATGSFQTWRQVRELDAFTSTTYGRTLLVKLGLFVGLIALAAVSRSFVRSTRPNEESMARLRVSVLAEAALAVAVLAATAMLVNAVPARQAVAQPVTKELTAGRVLVDLTIDPAKAGPATVHLYTLTPDGAVAPVDEATVRMRLRGGGTPIVVPIQRAGPAHFAAYGFNLPIKGEWDVTVSISTSAGTAEGATTIRVR